MSGTEQGSLPASDMGVAYTFLRIDPQQDVEYYECSECFKPPGSAVPVATKKAYRTQVLREHTAEHGYSAFTIGEKEPELIFKRVTAIRLPAGGHMYECRDCLMLCGQGELAHHAKRHHPGRAYKVDHEPAADAWRPGTGDEEGQIVPLVTYSGKERAVLGEATVFPDGRMSMQIPESEESKRLLGKVSGPISFGAVADPGFSSIQAKSLRDKSDQHAPMSKRMKAAHDVAMEAIVKNQLDEIGGFGIPDEFLPEGFNGQVVLTTGVYGPKYSLLGEDDKPVPFKGGWFIFEPGKDGPWS